MEILGDLANEPAYSYLAALTVQSPSCLSVHGDLFSLLLCFMLDFYSKQMSNLKDNLGLT